ncbi:Hypothetical predicted protein [Lecanosticta acicola]|uniref:Uncharacterized protein n=1 Tax=Lecanosticta acicola TaxID=111012 RepID=A0AAI8Z2G9_9PEZI|nr:Hypothetical predicted protein [Lecanosticta acicola]
MNSKLTKKRSPAPPPEKGLPPPGSGSESPPCPARSHGGSGVSAGAQDGTAATDLAIFAPASPFDLLLFLLPDYNHNIHCNSHCHVSRNGEEPLKMLRSVCSDTILHISQACQQLFEEHEPLDHHRASAAVVPPASSRTAHRSWCSPKAKPKRRQQQQRLKRLSELQHRGPLGALGRILSHRAAPRCVRCLKLNEQLSASEFHLPLGLTNRHGYIAPTATYEGLQKAKLFEYRSARRKAFDKMTELYEAGYKVHMDAWIDFSDGRAPYCNTKQWHKARSATVRDPLV